MARPNVDRSLSTSIYWQYFRFVQRLSRPILHRHLMDPRVGEEYDISSSQKRELIRAIRRTLGSVTSATGFHEHLLLVARLLSIPRSVEGDVVECGCFKGSSTASLSLACRLVGRRLVVCDSFDGLPEPASHDRIHVSLGFNRFEQYEKGEYRGTIDEVRSNIRRFGDIEVCSFVHGYFDRTLASLSGPIAMIFLDVDLHDSLRTCLEHLWPRLSNGGYLYTHEAQQLEYVTRFFDDRWWQSTFGQSAPGLVGAGSGLAAGLAEGSGLGYAVKIVDEAGRDDVPPLRSFNGDPTRSAVSD